MTPSAVRVAKAGGALLVAVVGVMAVAWMTGPWRPAADLISAPIEGDAVQAALLQGKPTVAEFGSSKCVGCREMKNILDTLSREHGDQVNAVMVDVLANRAYLRHYQIQAIPTQIFFDKDGREIGRHLGVIAGEDILRQLGVGPAAPRIMNVLGTIAATFAAGVLSSATPCVVAAVPITVGLVGSHARSTGEAVRLSLAFVGGMTLSFVALGLMAARLGLFFGMADPLWAGLVGGAVAVTGVWLFLRDAGFAFALPLAWQSRFRGSGWRGAVVLGALVGTAMSPCATPPLAAALAFAGTGALHEGSVWIGGAMLLAYGLGHSMLLLVAGVAPVKAHQLLSQLNGVNHWLPGRRIFAGLMAVTGVWFALSGLLP